MVVQGWEDGGQKKKNMQKGVEFKEDTEKCSRRSHYAIGGGTMNAV